MKKYPYGKLYKISRGIVRLAIPRYKIEPLPETSEATVYVSHHQNMIGPVTVLAWLEIPVRTWVFGMLMNQKDCFDHYVNYTFTKRLGLPRSLAKMVAWPMSYFVSGLMNSGGGIPVYRKSKKIMRTMRTSVEALQNEEDILIFPDVDYSNNSEEVGEIYEGFLFLEKYYYRKTGKHISFVPLYSDKKEKIIRAGEAIRFRDGEKFGEERSEVAQKLHNELNRLAAVSKPMNQTIKTSTK